MGYIEQKFMNPFSFVDSMKAFKKGGIDFLPFFGMILSEKSLDQMKKEYYVTE
ncbi:MAG: hypothetical protein QT08_C0011G0012 [archaeon GW2011_AR17]|nr:MAG: hypothetical protein QT08_C0011G0012 [archaeon GW2011_AR17]